MSRIPTAIRAATILILTIGSAFVVAVMAWTLHDQSAIIDKLAANNDALYQQVRDSGEEPVAPPADQVAPDAGADGSNGFDGANGRDGKDGRNGLDGKDGEDSLVPGAAGADGANGSDGADGRDGKDGADSTVPGPQGDPGPACPGGFTVSVVWVNVADTAGGEQSEQPVAVCRPVPPAE